MTAPLWARLQKCPFWLRFVRQPNAMISVERSATTRQRGLMPQVPAANDGSAVRATAAPPMTWNGTLVDAAETETYYLHLSAFPCEKCNGPVVAGFLGTRRDHISKETDIRKIGAACISCGFRPIVMLEPSVDHHFRPVEWKWAIKDQTADPSGASSFLADQTPAEL